MLRSAGLFFRGPVWLVGGAVSFGLAVLALVQFIRDQSFWMWLFFAAIALVVASFYTFHRQRLEVQARAGALPSKLDDLARDGIQLLSELSQPVQPKRDEKSSAYSLVPDTALWDQAIAFDQRVRDLLIPLRPSLLVPYADAANASLRRYREKEAERDEKARDLSNAEKLMQFVESSHRRPAAYVEAFLAGVAETRNRLSD